MLETMVYISLMNTATWWSRSLKNYLSNDTKIKQKHEVDIEEDKKEVDGKYWQVRHRFHA